MKAYTLKHGQLAWREVNEDEIGPYDVRVALQSVGLNRRDLYIQKRVGNQAESITLGSDGAGIIQAIGEKVTNLSVGEEVIINPALRWYYHADAPPEEFDILGMPDNGTFAENIVIHEEQVERKPSYLSWEEASVLALSALTGYRALVTQGKLQKGETVFIPGGSSGVATYVIQFAVAIGAKVIVSTRKKDKIETLYALGAHRVLMTDENWDHALANETIDLVIESVGAATFNSSLSILKKGGKIVVFGATTVDEVTINLREFFYGQYQMFGSTMGSREELRAALQLMDRHTIRPYLGKVYAANQMESAFSDLEENKYIGKLAVTLD